MTTVPKYPLSGVRIWLSGSVPQEATPAEAARLQELAKTLAKATFQQGGHILHGFHPSLIDPLLAAAREHRVPPGQRAPLSLLVSTYFRDLPGGDSYGGRAISELERHAELQQIPQAPTLERSLDELRQALAAQADVLVAIGGKWWNDNRTRAGVPAEFLLAVARGIPVFLLSSLGGATQGYSKKFPEILRNLRNGLDESENIKLAGEADVPTLVDAVLAQSARLPLGRRETASGQRFRILCLDGGGLRGAFTAAALAKWEEMSKLRVADHFDLIAGTSTGGLLAIGLGLGLSAQEMVEFYRRQGANIFPMTGFFQKLFRGVLSVGTNKFDASKLESLLSTVYDRKGRPAALKDSKARLLITSYNLTTNDLRLYRTSHHPAVDGHDHLPAVVVARATSAAPTYFRPAAVDDPLSPHEAVDGGVWANCPAMAAVGEAVGVLKVPLDRLDVLSVGTATLPALVDNPLADGKVGWGLRAADLFMNSQMDGTLLYLRQVLGDRFLRVDDDRPRVEEMDDPGKLDYLIGKGAAVGEATAAEVLGRFVNGVSASPWRALPKR